MRSGMVLLLALAACDTLRTPAGLADDRVHVLATSPSGAGAALAGPCTVTFGENVDPTTVTASRFDVEGLAPGTTQALRYEATTQTAFLTFDRLLPTASKIRVVVRGGSGGVLSTRGETLVGNTGNDFVFEFRTVATGPQIISGAALGAAWSETPRDTPAGLPRYKVFSVTGDRGTVGAPGDFGAGPPSGFLGATGRLGEPPPR